MEVTQTHQFRFRTQKHMHWFASISKGPNWLRPWRCGKIEKYPDLVDQLTNPTGGYTLSNFISLPSGTGMMACLCFFPNLFMWLSYLDVSRKIARRVSIMKQDENSTSTQKLEERFGTTPLKQKILLWFIYLSLVGYQFCFGMFLASPCMEKPRAHGIFVVAFILLAITHFMSSLIADFNWAAFLISVPTSALCAFVLTSFFVFSKLDGWMVRDMQGLGKYLFWMVEVVGLTAGMWFAPMYLFTRGYDMRCGCCRRRRRGRGEAAANRRNSV